VLRGAGEVSFLKALEHDIIVAGEFALKAAPAAGELIGFINPPLGTAIVGVSGYVSALVVKAEQIHTVPGSGKAKSADVQAAMQDVAQILTSFTGKSWTIDPTKLQPVIDTEVELMNARAEFVPTVKQG
jgi:hypothetical protein